MAKYIFVAGGVMSGVGKGVAVSSIGKILEARGFEVTAIKIDPYVNVDAGTMNPTEHGEVFVLDDGTECDQDMGNYERFLGRDLTRTNYMTTGSIYLSVIQKERNLEYGGRQVEVVPRIPMEVIERIDQAAKKNKAEIVITEIGGTAGEYENILFLEAVRMLKLRHPGDVVLVLVSFVPALGAGGNELKTKPTQHAVRSLNAVGLNPDLILARAHVPMDDKRKEKKEWRAMVAKMNSATKSVKIGIVGKYFGSGEFVLEDSYISVIESIRHAAGKVGHKPEIVWLNSEQFEKDSKSLKELDTFDGIIVPGGFGSRGIEGKISVIKYCREKKIPYFGLCYGMQLAVVEFSRFVVGLKNANTTEINKNTSYPVIDILPEQ